MPRIVKDNLDADDIRKLIAQAKKAGTGLDRIAQAKGLFLHDPLGRAVWRLRYLRPQRGDELSGKPNHMTYKDCPPTNVVLARQLRDADLALLAQGIDPADARDAKKTAKKADIEFAQASAERVESGKSALHSFKHIAEEFIAHCETKYADDTINAMRTMAGKWVFPIIGDTHIAKVSKVQALEVTTKLQAEQKWDTLGKARRFIADVYDFADTKAHTLGIVGDINCPLVKDKFLFAERPNKQPRAAVIDRSKNAAEQASRVRKLVLDILADPMSKDGKQAIDDTPNKALLFALLTGQRTDNIVNANTDDVDLDAGRWVIPGEQMKGLSKDDEVRPDHVVMLSTQAVALLREQAARFPGQPWFFPGKPKGTLGKDGLVLTGKAMNEKAMGKRLEAMGYCGGERAEALGITVKQTGHGLRSIFRTVGEKLAGCSAVVLEAFLAHKAATSFITDGGMKGVYNRDVEGIDEEFHQAQAQKWADWLDALVAQAPQKPSLTLVATQAPVKLRKAA